MKDKCTQVQVIRTQDDRLDNNLNIDSKIKVYNTQNKGPTSKPRIEL